jgi:hypothetical protein
MTCTASDWQTCYSGPSLSAEHPDSGSQTAIESMWSACSSAILRREAGSTIIPPRSSFYIEFIRGVLL